MKKNILSIMSVILVSTFLIGCKSDTVKNSSNSEKNELKLVVSTNPLREFTEKIVGDKGEVTCIVPNNMEPHDYEPKTKDLELLIKSDGFIYNGLGLESWVDKVEEISKDKNVLLVNSSENVDVRKEEQTIDPHSWLSLKEAEKQSETIKNAIIKLDEVNKDYYEENYNSFKNELDNLYSEYKDKFDKIDNRNFVTGHEAFGYLCREFNLEQRAVENLLGEGEPTPKQLEELVKFCKENNIKTIFTESLASPKVSETLANEVGAKIVPIYTLESKEDDKNYEEAMKYNLEQIYSALSESK